MDANGKGNADATAELLRQLDLEKDRYLLVDIGANLTNKKYARDLDQVITRSLESGVTKVIVTGTSVQESKEALRLTHLYPGTLYCTAGVHPHDSKTWRGEEDIAVLKGLLTNKECVAVGETGLDFNRNFSPPDDQIRAFRDQVQLACDLGKPMFVHERDAHKELIEILAEFKSKLPPTVVHCWTGKQHEARAYIEMGLYIGLTGFLWKDRADDSVRAALKAGDIPLDRLLVETDAPYMFPNVKGGKLDPETKSKLSQRSLNWTNRYASFARNEPCSLPLTLELIAAYMGKPPEEVAIKTTFNALKVFGLT